MAFKLIGSVLKTIKQNMHAGEIFSDLDPIQQIENKRSE
jgi:hypothetical protein